MTDPEYGTTELDDSYLDTVTYQGREFQKYAIDNGINFTPVDDEEVERLELQQRVLNKVFDDRLIFPPIQRPGKILDCGYGSGAWAIEVADQYPSCEVIGVDITPHMKPDETPENLWLQVDDLNRHFTFSPNQFDLVHSRFIASGIEKKRWPRYVRDIARVLKRGGWAQMVEIYFNVQSDSGSLTEDHALRKWSSRYIRALDDTKDVRAGMKLASFMTAAGLVDVETKMIPLPLSAWSNDQRMRMIGGINKDNARGFLGSLALYPFTQQLQMSTEEFEDLVSQARQEAEDTSLRAYVPMYVCIGRKP